MRVVLLCITILLASSSCATVGRHCKDALSCGVLAPLDLGTADKLIKLIGG